ncbi:LysR family transcriptional regulator [Salinibacillus xinjiangensis]|nr:LysR family transcriptional regulator [Salinibacillus xinjiangensis]
MEIKYLEVFNKICEHQNFSSAARELTVSQPTVSAQMKTLEETLGLQLFKRKHKTMGNLTDAGKILYSYSNQILSLVEEAEEALKHYKYGNTGSLSLVTSHTFCLWYLPPLLEKFKQNYPSLEIVLHTEFTPKMIDMVDQREVHFAFIRTGSPNFTDDRFHNIYIGEDPSVFVVSANHWLAQKETVSIDDVRNEPFIVFGKKSTYWTQIENIFTSEGMEPRISMELNNIQTVKKMLEINMGISVLPLISIQEELNKGTLKVLDVEPFPDMIRYSHLIYQKDLIMLGPVLNFLNYIKEEQPFTLKQ